MRRSRWFQHDFVLLLVLVALAIGMMFLSNDPARNGPIQTLAVELVGRLAKPVWLVRQFGDQLEDNRLLRLENARLKMENARLQEAYHENIRLHELLKLELIREYDCVPAKVIGQDRTGIHTLLISAGEGKGVRANMPVVCAQGLVGKVQTAGPSYSRIQLLIDSNFRVAARIQRSRVEGIFRWSPDQGGLLTDVQHREDVRVGDVLITSGISTLFPGGLEIGTVTQVDSDISVLFQEIQVAPSVDLNRLEEVFVILNAQSLPQTQRTNR
jgi:rod shape-determining protein MreC